MQKRSSSSGKKLYLMSVRSLRRIVISSTKLLKRLNHTRYIILIAYAENIQVITIQEIKSQRIFLSDEILDLIRFRDLELQIKSLRMKIKHIKSPTFV